MGDGLDEREAAFVEAELVAPERDDDLVGRPSSPAQSVFGLRQPRIVVGDDLLRSPGRDSPGPALEATAPIRKARTAERPSNESS